MSISGISSAGSARRAAMKQLYCLPTVGSSCLALYQEDHRTRERFSRHSSTENKGDDDARFSLFGPNHQRAGIRCRERYGQHGARHFRKAAGETCCDGQR
jgi:hypothetical protein